MKEFSLDITKISFLLIILVCFSSCVWDETDDNPDYLTLDDSEYPYAGLPRVVIETDNFSEIRDTETKIPAKLQIWGKDAPESDVMELMVRGRGTSSFKSMPKFSIKLELTKAYPFFQIAADKEWALIANFADRTFLKNYSVYKLSQWLGFDYSPKGEFVELYLNRIYMGIYLFSETIKVSKKRVNLLNTSLAFLLEKTSKVEDYKDYVFTKKENLFRIRYPKKVSSEITEKLKLHLDSLEYSLDIIKKDSTNIGKWILLENLFSYYWVQEFSKNSDGAFHRSVYLTWIPNEPLKFGPLWDFDMAFGNRFHSSTKMPYSGWIIKNSGWFAPLFSNKDIWTEAGNYWKKHKNQFEQLNDSLDLYKQIVKNATNNEFKRWNILNNTEHWAFKEGYNDYDEAVDSLKLWITNRIQWIDEQLN